MSGSKSESSGTTCANYFEKQFLAVVAGIAKSFDRYDTGSIESLQCRGTMASIQTSQCRMSRCIGQMDRCPRDDELPVQLFGCPFTKKKKRKKKQKISWKRVARNQASPVDRRCVMIRCYRRMAFTEESFYGGLSEPIDEIVS